MIGPDGIDVFSMLAGIGLMVFLPLAGIALFVWAIKYRRPPPEAKK